MEDVASRCGILSVEDWMLAPDGRQYRYFWCETWVRTSDSSMNAMVDGTAVILVSADNACGWCLCVDPPTAGDCYIVKSGK